MDDMLHVMEWHNGEKEFSPFSDKEMARRQNELRAWMGKNDVDASLFTRLERALAGGMLKHPL